VHRCAAVAHHGAANFDFAAIAHIVWLPGYTPLVNNYIALFYQLLMLAPAVVYDVVKLGHPRRAYIIGLGAFAPFVGIALVFWDSPGWHRVVSTLIGW